MRGQFLSLLAGVGIVCAPGWGVVAQPAPVAEVTTPPEAGQSAAGPEMRVIVLLPVIRFESVRDESPIRMEEGVTRAYSDVLMGRAMAMVQGRKLALVETDSTVGVADIVTELQPLVARLARGALNPDAVAVLGRLGALDQNLAVIAMRMRAKSGVGGSWNSYSGAITSSMATTELSAALVSCAVSRVVWKNELAVRNVPAAASKEFTQKVTELFKGF